MTRLTVVFSSVMLLIIAALRIANPYDVGDYEAGTWAPALLIASGKNPYGLGLTVEPPFVMAPYGPFYYGIVGLGLRCLGFQLWFGRIVAVGCLLVSAACIWRLTTRLIPDRDMAPLGVLIFLTQFPVQAWSAVHRPDFLALALSLLGLTVVLGSVNHHSSAFAPMLAGILLSLAILTRQTSILPTFLAAGWYLLGRQFNRLTVFLVTVAGLVGGVFAMLQVTSNGGYLWQAFILPAGVMLSAQQLFLRGKSLLQAPATWVAGLCYFAGLLRVRSGQSRSERIAGLRAHAALDDSQADAEHGRDQLIQSFPASSTVASLLLRRYATVANGYLVCAIGLAAVTSARSGANVNYWLEPCAALGMVIPALWLGVCSGPGRWRALYVGLVVAVGLAGLWSEIRLLRGEWFRWAARPYLAEVVNVIERLTPAGSPVFAVYPDLAVKAHRRYYFNDFVQYDGRSSRHKQLLEAALDSGVFPTLVTHERRSPAGYRLVTLAHQLPPKVYPVFVHELDSRR